MSRLFAVAGPHISIAPDTLFHVGSVPITNSMLLQAVGFLIFIVIMFTVAWQVRHNSRSKFMHAIMWIFETLYGTIVEVVGSRSKAKKLAPLAITLFLVITINNWLGLLPVVGESVTYNGMPLFRGMAADLNITFAMAIISMVTVQLWAIKRHGLLGNLHRYVHNPLKEPAHAFEGFLELIAEVSRLTALSMRLFGNVFGGEVLLAVIGFITGYAAPLGLPVFMALELFVGTIQAYVFFMLTVVFVSLGSTSGEGHEEPDDTRADLASAAAASK